MICNRIIFVLVLLLFSCNDSKTEQKEDATKEIMREVSFDKSGESSFYMVLKAKFSKWDRIHLYYTEYESEKYSGNKKIQSIVNPSNDFQTIKFKIEEAILPINLRLDLGENKSQSSIQIEECILNYGQFSYIIKGKDLHKYFHFNKGIETTSDPQTLLLKTFKRDNTEIYDPFIRGKQSLKTVLETKFF